MFCNKKLQEKSLAFLAHARQSQKLSSHEHFSWHSSSRHLAQLHPLCSVLAQADTILISHCSMNGHIWQSQKSMMRLQHPYSRAKQCPTHPDTKARRYRPAIHCYDWEQHMDYSGFIHETCNIQQAMCLSSPAVPGFPCTVALLLWDLLSVPQ